MRFFSFSLKITHGFTEGLCERTQGLVSPGVDKIFLKGQTVDILGCDHSVSVTTTQLCYCSSKTAMDDMQIHGHGCVPMKLYLHKKGARPDFAHGPKFANL